jgi:hypothetical protein
METLAEKIGEMALTVILVVLIVGVGIIVLNKMSKAWDNEEMFFKCCNSSPCSDTYYNRVTNKCHLTMCPKSECDYEAIEANFSMNVSGYEKLGLIN